MGLTHKVCNEWTDEIRFRSGTLPKKVKKKLYEYKNTYGRTKITPLCCKTGDLDEINWSDT